MGTETVVGPQEGQSLGKGLSSGHQCELRCSETRDKCVGSADLSSWPVGGDQDTSEARNLLKELILCLKFEVNTHRLSWKSYNCLVLTLGLQLSAALLF